MLLLSNTFKMSLFNRKIRWQSNGMLFWFHITWTYDLMLWLAHFLFIFFLVALLMLASDHPINFRVKSLFSGNVSTQQRKKTRGEKKKVNESRWHTHCAQPFKDCQDKCLGPGYFLLLFWLLNVYVQNRAHCGQRWFNFIVAQNDYLHSIVSHETD